MAATRPVAMGPFTVTAAMQAAPDAAVKGLIVLSHGTGGSELGHSSLAQALAGSGYLVAALRHPGDNWQDTSLRDGPGADRYFAQRPAQVSQVIDVLRRTGAASRADIARDTGLSRTTVSSLVGELQESGLVVEGRDGGGGSGASGRPGRAPP
jgi:predicted dienelactone hydrolase